MDKMWTTGEAEEVWASFSSCPRELAQEVKRLKRLWVNHWIPWNMVGLAERHPIKRAAEQCLAMGASLKTWHEHIRGKFKHLSNQRVWSHSTVIPVKQELFSICPLTHSLQPKLVPLLPSTLHFNSGIVKNHHGGGEEAQAYGKREDQIPPHG